MSYPVPIDRLHGDSVRHVAREPSRGAGCAVGLVGGQAQNEQFYGWKEQDKYFEPCVYPSLKYSAYSAATHRLVCSPELVVLLGEVVLLRLDAEASPSQLLLHVVEALLRELHQADPHHAVHHAVDLTEERTSLGGLSGGVIESRKLFMKIVYSELLTAQKGMTSI